jgi:hypothetical protein
MLKQKETRKDLHLMLIKREQRGEDIEEDLKHLHLSDELEQPDSKKAFDRLQEPHISC